MKAKCFTSIGKSRNNDCEVTDSGELFDNLWLFDPAWDRVTGHTSMEVTATTHLQAKKTASTKKDRIDIVYRNPAGEHVVIEMKRPKATTPLPELEAQVGKYKEQLANLLREDFKISNPIIKTYLLVGSVPSSWTDNVRKEEDMRALTARNTVLVTYKELVGKSEAIYREFLKSDTHSAKLSNILEKISNAFATNSGGKK